jgi:hypothetical protein
MPEHPAIDVTLSDVAGYIVIADGANKLAASRFAALPSSAVSFAVLLPFGGIYALQADFVPADPQAVAVNRLAITCDVRRKWVVGRQSAPPPAVVVAEQNYCGCEG